jgi:hypothetical protein
VTDSDTDEEGSNDLSDPPSPDNSNPNPVNTNPIPKKEKVNYTVPPTTGTTGSMCTTRREIFNGILGGATVKVVFLVSIGLFLTATSSQHHS